MSALTDWLSGLFKPKAPPPIPTQSEAPAEPKPVNPWRVYVERKRRLEAFNLTPDEYQRQCRRIADELGI